jgi:hypothetical protein
MPRIAVAFCLLISHAQATAQVSDALPARAEDPSSESSQRETLPMTPRVKEAQPSILYLLDKQGKPVPVIGFPLEEFERMQDLVNRERQRNQRPPFVVQDVSLRGQVVEDRAELDVQVEVVVNDEGWVRIPLRMANAVLRESPSYSGPGQYVFSFDDRQQGYVAWLNGVSSKPHRLGFKTVVALKPSGGLTQLSLQVAAAPNSQLRLTVPVADLQGNAPQPAQLDTIHGEQNTEFVVIGGGGDYRLSWRAGDPRDSELSPVLEATGSVQIGLDGRTVSSVARLNVRSLGGPFQRFRVRIPPGSELVPSPGAAYELQIVEPSGPGSDDAKDGPESDAPGSTKPDDGVLESGDARGNNAGDEAGADTTQEGASRTGGANDSLSDAAGQGKSERDAAGPGQPGQDESGQKVPDLADLVDLIGGAHAGRPSRPLPTIVEVRLAEETLGPVEVSLVTRQTYRRDPPVASVELAGFEVVDAVRQSGQIGVVVHGDWEIQWGPRRNVRQVARLLPALEREDLVGRFEYVQQPNLPCSLLASVVPRRSHLRVEPDYSYRVFADRIELTAMLRYSVRGSMPAQLTIELPDVQFQSSDSGDGAQVVWHVDEVGPPDLIEVAATRLETIDPLTITLSQPTPDLVDLVLKAHGSLPANIDSLAMAMPRPSADTVNPLRVTISAAENVELTPREEALVGLSELPVAEEAEPGASTLAQWQYRGEDSQAVFHTDFAVHQRQVDVRAASHVTVSRESSEVLQTFSYQIDYEPLSELTLLVPSALAQAGRLAVRFKDETLPLLPLVEEGGGPATVQRMVVRLPEPQRGKCELSLRYAVSDYALLPEASAAVEMPLVMPDDGELASNRLTIQTESGIAVVPRSSQWKVVDDLAENRPDSLLTLSAPESTERASLMVTLDGAQVGSPLIVERAWIQSWLDGQQRHDRVIYRVNARGGELNLTLPSGVDPRQVSVTVNGRDLAIERNSAGTLAIPFGPADRRAIYVVELRYRFRAADPLSGKLSLEAPRVEDETLVRRTYWQVVLPRTKHLLTVAPQFAKEFQWRWEGFFWGRNPVWEQPHLERWVGAYHTGGGPTRDTNRYLFSQLGDSRLLEMRVADRWFIVLIGSGAVLVFGLLLIRFPVLRHPGALLCAAVVVLSLGIVFPEPTLLFTQTAMLGLALVALALWLDRRVGPRPRRDVIAPTMGSTASAERGSSRRTYRSPTPGSHGSTKSGLVEVELSGGDSKS